MRAMFWQVVSAQSQREAWIGAAAEAAEAAAGKIKAHKAASALAVRVSQAAAALATHKASEAEQLRSLRDDLSRCFEVQRAHGDRVLEMQAQGELLTRQLCESPPSLLQTPPSPPHTNSRRGVLEFGSVALEFEQMRSLCARGCATAQGGGGGTTRAPRA